MTFVKTSDAKTVELLEREGFTFVCKENDKSVFIFDEDNAQFSQLENCTFTSKLCY